MTEQNRRLTDQLPDVPLEWEGVPTGDAIRVERQNAAITAGVALLKATGTEACAVLIPGAEARYVAVGDRAGIAKVLELAAPQAEAGKVEVPEGLREFVEAVANDYKGCDNQERLQCYGCNADIDDNEPHEAHCIVLRARALLAASLAAPIAEEGQSGLTPEKLWPSWPNEKFPATGEGQQQDEQARMVAHLCSLFAIEDPIDDASRGYNRGIEHCVRQIRASLSSPSERHEAEELSYAPPADHEALEADADRREQEYFDRWPDRAPASAEPVQVLGDLRMKFVSIITGATSLGEQRVYDLAEALATEAAARLAAPSSPSGEIGTVDTPEFKDALNQWVWANLGAETDLAYMAIIAHIDQHTAQAVKAAREEAQQWISVDERLPEVGELVMVYSPPTKHDHPGTVNIGFDCIDPNDDDHASWLGHNEHYEHFCCVAKPEGSIGPSEKAPYTHWMPLPPAPQPSVEQGEK